MKKLFILFTVLLVLGSACKKDFLSVDEVNPNNASAVPASFILPAALNYTSILMNTPGNYAFVYEWYGLWSISAGYAQDASMTQYNLLNTHFQGNWSSAYTNLQNYDYIEKASADPKQRSYRAIAKIMKAYVYQTLVDAYGNVPYSEALKADKGILKPKYDDQQAIYEDLVVQLDTAMNLIATTSADAEAVGAKDIIYNGDMTAWAKFANTLKLRMLINQSDMSGRTSYITGEISQTASVGYIGAGEGAWLNPGYLQTAGKMNPFWERFYKQDNSQQADGLNYYAAGQDVCNFLTSNNDPRKLRFFRASSGTTILGSYFGANTLAQAGTASQIGPGMLQAYNQNSPILTDIESLFIQAEAAQRGLITGDPKSLYEAAVTASILYEGQKSSLDASTYTPLTEVDAAAYLAQTTLPGVNFDAASNKLRIILTQKWCALDGLSPLTVWTDYRRAGFPDGTGIHFTEDNLKKNATPPVRLLYPQTEISTNNDNVILQNVSTTDDLFTKKIFWQSR
jgi:hypothetical protein